MWELPGLFGKCFNEWDEFRGTVLKVRGTLKQIYGCTSKRSRLISFHQNYLHSIRAGAICLLKGKTKIMKNVLLLQNTVSGHIKLL